MTDVVQQPDETPDRRRASRTALRLSATMRVAGRSRVGVRVIDLSTHGCRIEADATAGLAADVWIWLSIAGMETQYCRVVWQCQEFAGLEFATPLAEPVLERLLQDHRHLSAAAISDLRDIAVRAHRLATTRTDADIQILAELSRNCAVEAVVEGFRLGEAGRPDSEPPQK